MKVKDVMEKDVVSVLPNSSIYIAANLIFGHGINGLPVIDRGRIVGIITERDILRKFFPSLKEYIEDQVHESNFELMEEKAKEILAYPVEDIMRTDFKFVTPDTPLLKASSIMEIHKIGRLPVVDSERNLKVVGIIAMGDIFRALVGKNLTTVWGQEQFHDWFASIFDRYINWQKRLAREIPIISRVLKNNKNKIIDIGCGTGEHAIALAKLGYEVLGIDQSENMIRIAEGKAETLPAKIRKKISFRKIKTEELDQKIMEKFDAAIMMGGVITHSVNLVADLKSVVQVLDENHNTIIIQIPSYAIILEGKRRFNSLEFIKPISQRIKELAILTFYDYINDKHVNLNAVELERIGNKWKERGVATTALTPFTRKQIIKVLNDFGYKRVETLRDRSFAVFNPQEGGKTGIILIAKK